MHRIRSVMMIVAVATLCALAAFDPALAQDSPAPPADTPPTAASTASCSQYVGLSNRIVMCMRETVDRAAGLFFDPETGFYSLVSQMVAGFLTLVVIVYGILAAYGMLEKPGRDVMTLLVKLAFVTYFVVNVDVMYNTLTRTMDDLSAAVVRFTPNHGSALNEAEISRVECLKNMHEAMATQAEARYGPAANYTAAWLGMDCVLDSVVGIRLNTTSADASGTPTKGQAELTRNRKLDDEQVGMARGMINFFFSSMQTSVLGILVAIIGFVFLYTLVWMIMKALFVYVAGYIGLAFMMVFAPIFIPLVLFKATKDYFNKWVKLTIAFVLQPVIILAFVSFSIAAIDLALFSGDYSLSYSIAGDASRQEGFNLNKYMDDNKLVKRRPAVLTEIKTGTETPKLNDADPRSFIRGIRTSDCTKTLMEMQPSGDANAIAELQKAKDICRQSYAMQWWHNSVDWKEMAKIREPGVGDPGVEEGDSTTMTEDDRKGRAITREVFASILFLAVVVMCINGLMNIVPSMVNDLVGESFQSPNLFREIGRQGGGGGGNILGSGLNNMVSRFTQR